MWTKWREKKRNNSQPRTLKCKHNYIKWLRCWCWRQHNAIDNGWGRSYKYFINWFLLSVLASNLVQSFSVTDPPSIGWETVHFHYIWLETKTTMFNSEWSFHFVAFDSNLHQSVFMSTFIRVSFFVAIVKSSFCQMRTSFEANLGNESTQTDSVETDVEKKKWAENYLTIKILNHRKLLMNSNPFFSSLHCLASSVLATDKSKQRKNEEEWRTHYRNYITLGFDFVCSV